MANVHLVNLVEAFQVLKKFQMYLNLAECVFRINLASSLALLYTKNKW